MVVGSYSSQTSSDVVAELGADSEVGLEESEAHKRLVNDGPNRLAEVKATSRLAILGAQFNNSLVWVLLVAATVSGFVLNEWIDTGIIMAIVILNALLGYVQENKAEQALSELEAMSAPEALVRRNGTDQMIGAADLVRGDIVVLEAGDRIPADLRLVEAMHLQVDESTLTGESLPVEKISDVLPANLSMADRTNMAYSGTTISAGRGLGVVVETGAQTEFGKVAELMDVDEPATPLEAELDRVGKLIGVAALIIAAGIFALGMARGYPAETMFLTAVALAVAAIPEGLSAVVTVTLSRGVSAMAHHSAIVRRLPAVEALGATTVICTDKTGTLTRNEIRVQELEFADLRLASLSGTSDNRVTRYAQIASLCNDAHPSADDDTFIGNPTEVALLTSVDPVLVSVDEMRVAYPRLDEAAFDSSRKRMSTLHPTESGFLLLVKGAPEVILGRCSFFEDVEGSAALDPERRTAAGDTAVGLASQGLRTLALAYRELDLAPDDLTKVERDLTLVAIVGMSDETREEAFDAVQVAHQAGVGVVMITGDHQVTADAVARKLDIVSGDQLVMSGSELRERSEQELAADIEKYRVFARVDPADKVAIVKAWQSSGAIVAMTGDGVNDAPALRTADVGIAMGSGTAVARESADMVLADDNFATIVKAVEYGRGIFANLRHVVYFLLAANASEVLVMLFGFLLFGSLGEPLLAIQLLWINLVTDGLPALALGVDPAAPGIMERPPDRAHAILGRPRLITLGWQGAILASAALGAFVYAYFPRGLEFDEARTVLFTALVVVQMLFTYNVRAEGSSLRRVGFLSNRLLAVALLASLILQLGVVYLPIGNELFKTTPIAAVDLVAIAAFSIAAFLVVAWFNRSLFAFQRPQPSGQDDQVGASV